MKTVCVLVGATPGGGSLWTFGDGSRGGLGLGPEVQKLAVPTRLREGTAVFVAVAAGGGHSVALACDGTTFTWGDNRHGQLGLGDTETRWRPVLALRSAAPREGAKYNGDPVLLLPNTQ